MLAPLSQYSERLKSYRKRMHQFLGTKSAIASVVPVVEIEIKRFLFRTLSKPDSLQEQIER